VLSVNSSFRRDEVQSKTSEVAALVEKAKAASAETQAELTQLRETAEARRGEAQSALALKEEERAAIASRYAIVCMYASCAFGEQQQQ